jgi:ferredoxin-NADP reductase
MSIHTARLVARDEIAEGTIALRFEKPHGFEFKPGQAIDLVLSLQSATPDDQSARHAFSIVSAPFEDELVIATRLRDSVFKRSLRLLPIGSEVKIEGPFGSLGLHSNRSRAAIFLAGGIGITPFMSILRQATRDRLAQRFVLLYSNRRPEDAAFLAELQELEAKNSNFRLVATMAQMGESSQRWDGPTGRINGELVKSAVGDLAAPVFYVVGPPGMVEAMRQLLNRTGIDDDDIRSEEFYGY